MSLRDTNGLVSPNGQHLDKLKSLSFTVAPSPPSSSTTTTNASSSSNYISLSKLKNYMPRSGEPTTKFFSKYSTTHQSNDKFSLTSTPIQITRNNNTPLFDASGQVQALESRANRSQPGDQASRKLDCSPQSATLSGQETELIKGIDCGRAANHQESEELTVATAKSAALALVALNQLDHCVAQQGSEQSQKQSELSAYNSNAPTCSIFEAKKVESSGTTVNKGSRFSTDPQQLQQQQQKQQRHHPVVVGRKERKRNRIDSLTTYLGFKEIQRKTGAISKTIGRSCGKTNMTPSSLLLIQNRNYIERQHQLEQQRRKQEQAYADYNDRIGLDESSLATGTSVECENINRHRANEDVKQLDGGRCREPTDNSAIIASPSLNCKPSSSTLPSSSSTLMLSGTNHCKITVGQNSNLSSDRSNNSNNNNNDDDNNNNKSATSPIVDKGNFSETLSYLSSSDEDINRTLNHRSGSNLLDSFQSRSNFQSNYNNQKLASNEEFRSNRLYPAQFVHYNSLASQHRLEGQYFQSANQTLRPDDNQSYNDTSTIPKVDSANLNSLNDPARNEFSQQQQSSQKSAVGDQYYRENNSQYNLMPTPSSKSSSPHSDTTTPPLLPPPPPPPQPSSTNNAMQTLSVTHNNTTQRLLSAGLANNLTASESHIDHLNHPYASAIGSGVTLSHHLNQVSQHYSYSQQSTTGVGNQHQLNIANQDQVYAHQQQQQQHQQHLQQQQQQQQQQSNVNSQQQSVYHQITNGTVMTGGVSSGYSHPSASVQYHGHLQSNGGNHQANNLISEAHQSHLNTAAAACAAAAVVSQTLKTVVTQHNQNHHGTTHNQQYGAHLANGFGPMTGSSINMNAQHHQQFHNESAIGHHHHNLNQVTSLQQHQQQQHSQQQQQQQHHHHHHHLHQQQHNHNSNNHNHINNNNNNNHHHNQQQHQEAQLQSNRTIHQAASIVTRKYQCKMCPQVFMSKAEMKYHNQNHMREAKPYKCLQCPKAFANSSYLSQHMRIHQGVKPYTCDICTRKFTQLSHLQQHKRTHTGDKPYRCQYPNCTKQFSQLSNLQSHSRCHQLDKPYKCNSCYKCFQDEPSLLEHIPRHLESKHLKKNLCIFCGSSYQQERGLVKHFQQYHTDKTPTLVAAAIGAGTTGNSNLIASLISSSRTSVFATPSSGSTTSNSIGSNCSTLSNTNNGSGGGSVGSSSSSASSTASNSHHANTNAENSVNRTAVSGQAAAIHATTINSTTSGYHLGTSFF